MLYDVISLLIPFLGFAVSLALAACCILLLVKRTQIVTSLLYLVLAFAYSSVWSKALSGRAPGMSAPCRRPTPHCSISLSLSFSCSLFSTG